MLAEIFSKNSNRKFNIVILNHTDNQIVTTIPTLKNERVYFLPNELVHISIISAHKIYSFEGFYQESKIINGEHFFAFTKTSSMENDNIRKDRRIYADIPAILNLQNNQNYSFANILDSSKNGFKIETNELIIHRILHISYQNGSQKETKRVKITWMRKIGNLHYYGLQAVL